ncbi:putative zinc finger (CCCH type) protein [Neospora caninum Liverpool]|uniref:Putative zinc finger (CCCH type) protein n=1 Tax=Neospora caninum (strain Liverpool) TaxID=572307 RepID=F0VMJ0_NEOCL|nr:putative zinc finger (CCCH type) protein [Neospora caninum Liverpool]CBZ54936.1 putative zinc finger (CCCH type) protein [Neospora caninum Liverpool]CEL69658.1 TPA: zinc finger (CCCH type) protein, putative [Neospora caninum Liverpool]|eukprot:XP_003884964.1 putative zinc finger (CCCH type) protein [Neospora caninum Liverpool]
MGPPPTAASGAAGGALRQTGTASSGVSQSASSGVPSSANASPSSSATASTSPLIENPASAFPAPYGRPLVDAQTSGVSSAAPAASAANSGALIGALAPPPGRFTGNPPASPGGRQTQQALGGGPVSRGGSSRQRGEDRGARTPSDARALPGSGGNASAGPRSWGPGSLNQPGKGARGDGAQQAVAESQEAPHPRGNGGNAPPFSSTPFSSAPFSSAPPFSGSPASQASGGGRSRPQAGETRGASGGQAPHKWRGGPVAVPGGSSNNGSPATANAQKFYKTKFCPWYPLRRCTHGDQCSWAHSEQELRGFGGARNPRGASPGGSVSGGGGRQEGKGRERNAGSSGDPGTHAIDGSPSGTALGGLGLERSEGGDNGAFGAGQGLGVAVGDRGVEASQGQHHGIGGPRRGNVASGGGLMASEDSAPGPPSDRPTGSEQPHYRGGMAWGGGSRGSTSSGSYHHPPPRSGGAETGGAASGRTSGGMSHYSPHANKETHEHPSDASGGPSRSRGTGGAPGTGDRPSHGLAQDAAGPSVLFQTGGGPPSSGKNAGGGILGGAHSSGVGSGAHAGGAHGVLFHHGGPGGFHGPDKRKLCPYLSRKTGCYKGADCRFAHSEEEALNAAFRHQALIGGLAELSADGLKPGCIHPVGPDVCASVMMQRCDPEGLGRGEGLLLDPAMGFLPAHPKVSENYALLGAMAGYEGVGFLQGDASLPSQGGAARDDGGHGAKENRTPGTGGGAALGGQGDGDQRDVPASGTGGATGVCDTAGASLHAGTGSCASGPGGARGAGASHHHTQGRFTAAPGRRGTGPQGSGRQPDPGSPAGGNGTSPASFGSGHQAPGSHTGAPSREHAPQRSPHPMQNAAAAAIAAARLDASPASMGSYWLQASHAHALPHAAQAGSMASGPATPSGPLSPVCVPFGGAGSASHHALMGPGGPPSAHPGGALLAAGNSRGLYLAPFGGPGSGGSGGLGVVPVVMQFLASTEELNAAAPLFYED